MHIIRKVRRPNSDGRTPYFFILEIIDDSGKIKTRYSYFSDENEAAVFLSKNKEMIEKELDIS